MSKRTDKATLAIIDEANEWLIEMQEAGSSAAVSKNFLDWLRKSPVHVREYLRAEANWAALAGVDWSEATGIEAKRSEQDSNVIRLAVESRASESPLRENQRSHKTRQMASIAAAIIICIGVLLFVQAPKGQVYETRLGEQRRVVLDDGSIVELNTSSVIKVEMTKDSRKILLTEGEALFSVAKDASRPFIVETSSAMVQALGTQFNVYKKSNAVLVTVLEGRVSVSSGEKYVSRIDQAPAIQLVRGDRAEIVPNQPIVKSEADETDAIAWRESRLIFRDQPLSEVVDEFNRYNKLKLAIEDPALASQKISAVFDANSPRTLVKFISAGSNVAVDDRDAQRIIIRPNSD